MENKLEYFRKQLNKYKPRAETRFKCYDQKDKDESFGITIPPNIRSMYRSVVGWCTKAVDNLSDRLIFRGFANDDFFLNEIFAMNNPDTFFDSAILSALITSCCFVYIIKGEEGEIPQLQVIESTNATGNIDTSTGLLKEGYAVLERNKEGHPILEALFYPYKTDYYTSGEYAYTVESKAPYPVLIPIIHRPDAIRPFGRSRISRAAIYWQKYAKRTLERSDVTAEFYSFPQKYVLGLSQDAEPLDSWKATISAMLQFTKDEDGDRPTIGQFTTVSMSPFVEQLRTAAAGFAGETGLTLDDLGFVTDNPSSAEAIKASHETLRLSAKKAQRNLGSGFLNVGYIAACIRDGQSYNRGQFYMTKPKWEPVFEPDASTLSTVGDGAIKINQAIPGYLNQENLRDITGIEAGD